ncbi:hypothetical protein COCOBI_16-3350 [Coccomyxa sp. Obi]|nr:hypothetical protein COCOBI_16-3350 [Coccomyxa sp. Obi]
MHLDGGCLCGDVRYVIDGEPSTEESPCLCHCRICQRSSGAPLVAWATFRQEDVKFVQGEPKTYQSSATGVRRFCGRCGTQLLFQTVGTPVLDITIASLDMPDVLQPEAHIWTESKRSYMGTEDLPCFPERRPMES